MITDFSAVMAFICVVINIYCFDDVKNTGWIFSSDFNASYSYFNLHTATAYCIILISPIGDVCFKPLIASRIRHF